MITCKEDLVNTYIENDNGLLRDVYVSLLSIFDFKWAEGQKADKYKNLEDFIMVDVDSDIGTRSKKLFFSTERQGIKQLTITDLLPTSYENTKVYSLDEDVIRKYAELCGVEYNHGTIPATGEYVGVSWVMDEPDDVARFTDDSDVELGEYKTTTLTTEQILAAWDLRFNQSQPSIETLQSALGKSQLKVMELTEQLAVSVENYNNMKSRLLREEKQPQRTKVEYVKCEFEHAWQAVKAFEEGVKMHFDAAYDMSSEPPAMVEVASEMEAARYAKCDALYERTEVKIDWRDELFEFTGGYVKGSVYMQDRFNNMDIGLLTEDDFLEMCRVALRATGELTDKPQ